MAGVITHLVIAREILKLLPEEVIKNTGLFYMGSIAPDAVHARENYIRAYKKHSHFRDDIPDMDFEAPENYVKYHNRLTDFIKRNCCKEDGLLDLYRGYVAHIITDELFIISIRQEFCNTMMKLGIEQDNRLFFEYIVGDMTRNDMLLVDRYEGIDEIKVAIERAGSYSIEDYINSQELSDCRDWLVRQHFIESHNSTMPAFISYERTTAFIHMAAVEIVQRLTEDMQLPRML